MKTTIVTLISLIGALGSMPARAETPGPGVFVNPSAFEENAQALRKKGVTVGVAQVRPIVPGTDKDSIYTLIGPPHFGEGITRRWNYVLFLTDATGSPMRCRFQIEFKRSEDGNLIVDRLTWGSQECADLVSS